ncbi:uncharacterized protein LOC141632261 [Silene latifolia]|uniref:uncharacterized protein LOC141632261 n=1 Tax=Silene latifolia TaxID=37657 RepID=UPI003D777CA8
MLKAWLRNVINPKLHPSIAFEQTVSEVWEELKNRYAAGNAPRVHQLKGDLAECKQGRLSVIEYYTKLKMIWDELANYSKVPDCTCGAAVAIAKEREDEKVHQFMMGLNSNLYGHEDDQHSAFTTGCATKYKNQELKETVADLAQQQIDLKERVVNSPALAEQATGDGVGMSQDAADGAQGAMAAEDAQASAVPETGACYDAASLDKVCASHLLDRLFVRTALTATSVMARYRNNGSPGFDFDSSSGLLRNLTSLCLKLPVHPTPMSTVRSGALLIQVDLIQLFLPEVRSRLLAAEYVSPLKSEPPVITFMILVHVGGCLIDCCGAADGEATCLCPYAVSRLPAIWCEASFAVLILAQTEDPMTNLSRAYALTLREERHSTVTKGKEESNEAAMAARFVGGSREKGGYSGADQEEEEIPPPLKCGYCKKPYHTEENCYDKHGYETDQVTKTEIGRGEHCDGVYFFRRNKTEQVGRMSMTKEGELWHQRLGHPSSSKSSSFFALTGCNLNWNIGQYWGECALTAAYLTNRTPTPLLGNKTPYEIVYHKKPDLTNLRVLGCLCYAHNQDKPRDKFAEWGKRCLFLGYPHNKKGWKEYDLAENRLFVSRDVNFFEHVFPFYTPVGSHISTAESKHIHDELFVENEMEDTTQQDLENLEVEEHINADINQEIGRTGEPDAGTNQESLMIETESEQNLPDNVGTETLGRGAREKRDPYWKKDYYCKSTRIEKPITIAHLDHSKSSQSGTRYPMDNYVTMNCFSNHHRAYLGRLDAIREPTSYHEAAGVAEWREPMHKEVAALEANGTLKVVTLPKGKKPIGCKWVYKVKYKADGTLERYKARLVAQGFTQVKGVDYHETYALVAKMTSVRYLLAVAVAKKWVIDQLDVNNAFLHGDLEEEVYMRIPQGFERKGENKVCRLLKSIYGLNKPQETGLLNSRSR